MEPDRSVLAPESDFRKHHQLLTCRQQIHRVSANVVCSRLALVNGDARPAVAEPAMDPPAFQCGSPMNGNHAH